MATRERFEQKWDRWIVELKERCPLEKPVIVKRIKTPIECVSASMAKNSKPESHLGEVKLTNGKFVICVSALEPKQTQLDTLIHEWAHCVAYPLQRKRKTVWTHDRIYGIAYASTYRKFYNEPEP